MLRLFTDSPASEAGPSASAATPRRTKSGPAKAARSDDDLPQIVTRRLKLRVFRPGDHEALSEIMSRPETFEYSDRRPMTPEESWARLLRHAGHWSLFNFGMFAVEELASGAVIGEVGFADFHRGLGSAFDAVPEAAWTIAPTHWGRGYAQEAARAAHRWIDRNHRSSNTVCMIFRDNLRSLRVAVALGYRPFREIVYRGNKVVLFRRLAGSI